MPKRTRRERIVWRGLAARYTASERRSMAELRAAGTPADEIFLLHEAKALLDARIVGG